MAIGDTGSVIGNQLLGSGENYAIQQILSNLLNISFPGLGLLIGWGLSGFQNPFHKPAQVQGTFGFSGGGGGWEDSQKVSDPFWGNLGFLDQGTQQFSGQAALPFDQQILAALNKITSGATEAQKQQIRSDLQAHNFGTQTGGYTTESFLGGYGNSIWNQIQQIVSSDLLGGTKTPTPTTPPIQQTQGLMGTGGTPGLAQPMAPVTPNFQSYG
jgi:hypothetical protein